MNKLMMTVAAVGAMALGGAAQADSVSGMAGHGWPNHFDSCFGSSFTTMINNCGGSVGSSRLLIIPTQIYPSLFGRLDNVIARAGGNGSNGVTTCTAIAINSAGGGFSFSANVATFTGTSSQQLNLGPVFLAAGGTLHYECTVAQGGGRVFNVEF
jgi:hypothetical protein